MNTIADPTSQPSTASTTATTSTTSAGDVQRTGGEAKAQAELKQVDNQVGQPIADRPLDGTRQQKQRGIFIDANFTEGTDPTARERPVSQGSTPSTTSTTSSPMTTPTTSVTSTKPTSE